MHIVIIIISPVFLLISCVSSSTKVYFSRRELFRFLGKNLLSSSCNGLDRTVGCAKPSFTFNTSSSSATLVVHYATLTALNQIVISTQRFLQQETFEAKDLNHVMRVLR